MQALRLRLPCLHNCFAFLPQALLHIPGLSGTCVEQDFQLTAILLSAEITRGKYAFILSRICC